MAVCLRHDQICGFSRLLRDSLRIWNQPLYATLPQFSKPPTGRRSTNMILYYFLISIREVLYRADCIRPAVFAVLLRMLSVRGGMYPVRCRPAAAARLVRVGRGAVSAFPAGAFAVRPFYHHGGLAGRRGLLWGACRVAGYPAGAVQPRLFAFCGRQLLFVGAVCFAAAHVYPVG